MENDDEISGLASFALILVVGVSIWLVKESGDWMNLVYIYGGIFVMAMIASLLKGMGMDEGAAGGLSYLIYFVGNFVIYAMSGNPAFVAIPVGVSVSLMVVAFVMITK